MRLGSVAGTATLRVNTSVVGNRSFFGEMGFYLVQQFVSPILVKNVVSSDVSNSFTSPSSRAYTFALPVLSGEVPDLIKFGSHELYGYFDLTFGPTNMAVSVTPFFGTIHTGIGDFTSIGTPVALSTTTNPKHCLLYTSPSPRD